MILYVPPRLTWPRGFETDYVSAHPDHLWAPGWHPRTWFQRISIRPAGFWHDVSYFAGFLLRPEDALEWVRPRPDVARTEAERARIDLMFYFDLLRLGVRPFWAQPMHEAVRTFGGRHYFWAHGDRWEEFNGRFV